ncbi:MAG: glycosyltransferase family 2 protein [Usitatibacter sp.]
MRPDLALSIVVPVYRSEAILPRLADEVLAAVTEAGLAQSFELILVNDASPDRSWEVIRSLAGRHAFIRGLCLTRNFGQHNATMAGLNAALGEVVVVMDDDLQHPPAAIGALVAAIRSGYDVCYTRYLGRKHPAWKKVGSYFNDLLATWVLGKPRELYLSSYKALRRNIVREVVKYDGPYAYVDGLILDVTRHITFIPIAHGDRAEGEGNYGLAKSISLWLKMITSFSVLPLRLASVAGMAIAGFSLAAILSIVINKFLYPETSAGWSSLVASILFMGGLQLLFLGVIGEYLGRTYLKLNHKPQFVLRETTDEPARGDEASAR